MTVRSRQAGLNDREFCRSAHHLAYRDVAVLQFGPWDEQRQDEFFDAKWGEGNLDVLLADGEPCGFAVVTDAADHLRVVELVIHPDWQQRGIGTNFLTSVMARASERGIPVRLSVLHKNRAVGLYKRLGFTEQDRSATHVEFEWTASSGPNRR